MKVNCDCTNLTYLLYKLDVHFEELKKKRSMAKKTIILIFCVLVFYHDMCTTAMTYHAGNFDSLRSQYEKDLLNTLFARSYGNSGSDSNGGFDGNIESDGKRGYDGNSIENYGGTFQSSIQADDIEEVFETHFVEDEIATDKGFIDVLEAEGYNVTNRDEICANWEEFDGTSCVCSDQCSKDGGLNDGIVCDSDGNDYKNICDFSYKMCSAQISSTTNIVSCGICDTLKLTGSSIYPEDRHHGLGIFRRDTDVDNVWTAVDDYGQELKLFYSNVTQSWVVGSSDFQMAGIVFKKYTLHPQDSDEGAVVIVNGTYAPFDAFLHLECVTDYSIAKLDTRNAHPRQKRFGFLVAMVIISIVATTAQVTVTAVQKHRGCLFYQDVCDMKKEINDNLRPEVESLKQRYTNIVGDSTGFKNTVHSVFRKLLELKDKMVELRKLENEFRDLSQKIGPDLEFLSPDIADSFDTSFNDKWLEALGEQTAWGIFGLVYIQMPLEMISLITSTASKASMAFAAFGAVISVAAAVTAIVVSWQNEKSQRKQLRDVKRNLLDAKQKLNAALSHIKGFQVKFYRNVIYPLKKFTHHMRNYDNRFRNFYNDLVSTYGSSLSATVGENIYGKIKSGSVKTLRDTYLSPLLSFLSDKLEELKTKIKAYKDTEQLITIVRKNVNDQIYPNEILSLIGNVNRNLATKMVPNEYSLLEFIGEKVLQNKNCYWGFSLTGIRAKSVNGNNYRSVPLCNSPELLSIETIFQDSTNQNLSPERIVNRIQHNRFNNKYQKIKYLADFILPSKSCYWGYSLKLVRANQIPVSEINNANPSKPAFLNLKMLPENLQAGGMCSTIKICNTAWQTNVKCLLRGFNGGNMCEGSANCN